MDPFWQGFVTAALLILGANVFFDGSRAVWLPKSQIEVNDDGTVTMPEWLAHEKELI